MADHQIRIQHLKPAEHFTQVAGLEHINSRNVDYCLLCVGVFYRLLEPHLLEVQDDVRDIFLHSGYGVELVGHAVDAYRTDGKAPERRQEDAPERVAYRLAISRFQRTELESAERIRLLQHYNLFGLLKC